MISSYFILDSKFYWKNVFRIWFSVFSVSVIIVLILYFGKIEIVSFFDAPKYLASTFEETKHFVTGKELKVSLFPLYHNIYWFAGTYIIFYILSPFLNVLVKNLKQQEHFFLAIFTFLLVSFIPVLPHESLYRVSSTGLDVFIEIFFIISYLKFYSPKLFEHKSCLLIGFILLLCFSLLKYICSIVQIPKHNFIESHFACSWSYMIASVFIFSGFKKIRLGEIKVINKIAGTTFGIYLFHGQPLIYALVLTKIFHLNRMIGSVFLPAYTLFVVMMVFIICSILEIFRKKIIEQPVMNVYDQIKIKLLK